MKLDKLFSKPINRQIEGVIKADDDASLYLEFEEYVITNEVSKRLNEFLDAYLNYAGANGVWISGFFGSGKSHLLKILALLLQNKPIEGKHPLNVFLEKPYFNEDVMFANDLKRAVAIPSESILFNIDQKADVISKNELDALIAVFVKVFDDHCGFYGKEAYIAQFERELDTDGRLVEFKVAFQEVAGREWEVGRTRVKMLGSFIDQAYEKATGLKVVDIINKYRSDYSLSIEDFAEQVKAYIDSKEPDFRLNFFVDEVGQYIADNVKLMTNLQTLAESLATKCQGKSWIIVTAQEDMSSVLGDSSRQESSDFSKIQSRFKNRMKLTSQDVAEVIQLRLLEKHEEYLKNLSDLYHKQQNNFKTLFDFADGSQTYKNFGDREHFIRSYPFIPYQFTLFQASIQNLSRHSAFEGKHSSVGERSMLGVFQQVAIRIKERTLGELATFDLMFEGIRTALKGGIQQSILRAEKNLPNEFAVHVLKALFLVKYVKEFKSTIRNICVLMQSSFDRDLTSLKKDVAEALNLLEKETYIQRNGDFYEYLTDEEQDVEAEIKSTEIDSEVVATELSSLIFDGVIKVHKIRWDKNGQDYPFTRVLDGNRTGREYELGIHFVTPFDEYSDNFDKHKTDTVYNDEVRVILPENERLVRELMLYKRTEKYIAHETRTTQQDSIKRILSAKSDQNRERHNQLLLSVEKLIGQATFFVKGQNLELTGENGQVKVFKAFADLITQSYPNLKMLRGQQYSEADIATIISQGEQGLFGDEIQLPESQKEMFSHIQSNCQTGTRTTAKSLLNRFECKPYGWSFAAVLCVLAHLCARGKVEVRDSTNLIDNADLASSLLNTSTHPNLILDPQTEFAQSQVKVLKEFYQEYFEEVASPTEAKALAKEIQERFATERHDLKKLYGQTEKYPFRSAFNDVIQELGKLAAHDYAWFLTDLPNVSDDWLNRKEDLISPIRSFMKGSQSTIYDEARAFLTEQDSNLSYLSNCPEHTKVNSVLSEPTIYKGSAIQSLKLNLDLLKQKLSALVEDEKGKAYKTIDSLKVKLSSYEQFSQLEDAKADQLLETFAVVKQEINDGVLVAVIRDRVRRFDDDDFQRLIDQLLALVRSQKPEEAPTTGGQGGGNDAPSELPKPSETVSARDISVSFSKPELQNEYDIDSYLEQYRSALIEAIQSGKKVRV